MFEVCDRMMVEVIVVEVFIDFYFGGLWKRICGCVNYCENVWFLEDSSLDEMDDGMKFKKVGNENDVFFFLDLESFEGNGIYINYWFEKEFKWFED